MSRIRFLKKPITLVPLVAGILIPCVVFLALHFSRQANSQSQLVLRDAVVISGQSLPKTDLLDLNGQNVSPEMLRKGTVLLVFLTTNCPACQKELKLLSSVESEISDKVKIYGIGVEDQNQIINFIQANEVKTNILLDKNAKLMALLRVKYFPTKFLVKDGVIVNTWFGNSLSREGLFQKLGL